MFPPRWRVDSANAVKAEDVSHVTTWVAIFSVGLPFVGTLLMSSDVQYIYIYV